MSKELETILKSQLLVDDLDNDQLASAANRSVEEYEIDKQSRSGWEEKSTEALKIAEQVWEKKNTPWEGAANVKFPLISIASIQFGARSYPALIGSEIAKSKVIGADPDGAKRARADRVQKHMNYQLMEQMTEWEAGMDRLLCSLPVLGTVFKKTYFDPLLGRSVSKMCMPQDVVVNNDHSEDLDQARRITHCYKLWRNDVIEKQRGGLWTAKPITLAGFDQDEQGPFEFLEQHRWLDLDKDGYEEPYTVTIARETQQLVRIAPRFFEEDIQLNHRGEIQKIKAHQFFTKYGFMPDFCGKFYDLGFGQLLCPLNEGINTTINQLLDAGALATSQGGFISKALRIRGGEVRIGMGEWRWVDALSQDLRASIMPLPYKEPSSVLFQLLGLLIEVGKQLSSVSEVLSGEQSGVNVPATTTLALIEQGLKVFTAINKRVYRSLGEELKKLFYLNSHFLDEKEYYRILDEEHAIARQDYALGDCDIAPVADPNASSDTQLLIQAEALMKTLGAPGSADPRMIMHKYYEALKVRDLDKFHPLQAPPAEPPPEVMDIMAKIQERQAKLPYELKKLEAEALALTAKAESISTDQQFQQLQLKTDTLLEVSNQILQREQASQQSDQQSAQLTHEQEQAANERQHTANQAELDRNHTADQGDKERLAGLAATLLDRNSNEGDNQGA